jgi:hypothetical protein
MSTEKSKKSRRSVKFCKTRREQFKGRLPVRAINPLSPLILVAMRGIRESFLVWGLRCPVGRIAYIEIDIDTVS